MTSLGYIMWNQKYLNVEQYLWHSNLRKSSVSLLILSCGLVILSQMSFFTSGHTHQFIFWLYFKAKISQISHYILFQWMEIVCWLSGLSFFHFLTHYQMWDAELASSLSLMTALQLLPSCGSGLLLLWYAKYLNPFSFPQQSLRTRCLWEEWIKREEECGWTH